MPQSIPREITREHVLKALADIDAGVSHQFGAPTGYDLVFSGKRYPPKAAIGLAGKYALGRVLLPHEFSGGESAGQANAVLRELGFIVESKSGHLADDTSAAVEDERTFRSSLWARLEVEGTRKRVTPATLDELGLYGGGRGIWMDKARTAPIAGDGDGITVSVYHNGTTYADDLSSDCLLFHYPQTGAKSRDESEIRATKAAGNLQLPIFVITKHSKLRDVQIGWVESWDDRAKVFLITFGNSPPEHNRGDDSENAPFLLTSPDRRKEREALFRTGQQRFKFNVIKRYGQICAVCGVSVPSLLDAAHIRPKQKNGSDDARNGLVLCANHHRAYDSGLFAIEPSTLALRFRTGGFSQSDLGITVASLSHLDNLPHVSALEWHWAEWLKSSSHSGAATPPIPNRAN